MNRLLFLSLQLLPFFGSSQSVVSAGKDTIRSGTQLDDVVVEAFHARSGWKQTAAAVALVTEKEMNRYVNSSLVPVFNTIPGVRMEERSPASYRLSVRGSLLRAPFGVRNIKVYLDGIPLTDAGGNTYLNLVDMNMLSSATIIKGPAASSYGAGTGGAVLLHTALRFSDSGIHRFVTGITGGSYGLFHQQSGWNYSNRHFASSVQQMHQQSDGYRDQSASRRDIFKWQGVWQQKKVLLHFLFFYADLYYQTPGGITLAQQQQNPKLARQPAGALPGAVQQQTAVYNKTLLGAVQKEWQITEHLELKSFLSGNHTAFTNPFITNYEKRGESNFSAGTALIYQTQKAKNRFQWVNGAEWLYNHSLVNDFGNRAGKPDTVQFRDDLYAIQWFAYSQAQLDFADRWAITAGISLNNQLYRYKRLTDPSPVFADMRVSLVAAPRLAILYRLHPAVSLYLLAARGFSSPSLAEIRPSDGNYYGNLEAEYGWNYEAGIKGEWLDRRLRFDIAAYFFDLKQAIVRRTNTAGAEYFVNSGATRQHGMEGLLSYQLLRSDTRWVRSLNLQSSYSFQPYRFTDYVQSGINYSGNKLTGVPTHIWVSGMDIETGNGMYGIVSLNCTGALPLTDANDVTAAAYQLLQIKIGYRGRQEEKRWDIFAGADNLLNQRYSLGNDINAAGKRYYNPAAGRNVFAGMIYRF